MKKEYVDERKCNGINCIDCCFLSCFYSVIAKLRKEVKNDAKNLIDYFNQGLCLGLDCAYCLDKTCVLSKIDYSNEENEVKQNDNMV